MIGIRIEYLDSGSRPFGPFLRRLRLQYRANQVPQREPRAGPPRRRLVGRAGEAVAYTVPTVHRRRSDVTSLLNPAHFRTSRDTSSCTTSCVRFRSVAVWIDGDARNGKFNTTQYNLELNSIRVVSDRRPRAQLRCRLINGARRARGSRTPGGRGRDRVGGHDRAARVKRYNSSSSTLVQRQHNRILKPAVGTILRVASGDQTKAQRRNG